jgi:hypothetical protein
VGVEKCDIQKAQKKMNPWACKITKEKKEAIFQLIICKLLLLQLCRFSQLRFSQIAVFQKNKGGKEIIQKN